ncbi:MAG TPA: orotate phosphoribosyltransferase [Elusimicrobia bacterium]|nr:orotate phosphoribosyltransferase [Elusimicrobiota bacterium]
MTDYNKIFKKLGAVQKGHFILTSGNHSDTYVQCARILENPKVTAKLAKELIKPWNDQGIDIVVGPALGGIILSYELARPLSRRNSGWQRKGIGLRHKIKAMYLERVDGKLALRRGFMVPAGSKVIVAEDVITTGGSVKEVIDVIEQQGAKVLGIISLVDRRPAEPQPPAEAGDKLRPDYFGEKDNQIFGIKYNSIIQVNPPIYPPDNCPLCKKGIPTEKPGSRGLK